MSEIFCLVLSLIGIVSLLYYIMFKLLLWGEKGGVIIIPLYPSEKEPRTRIKNISKLFELIGLNKICTSVIVDYGAQETDIQYLKDTYRNDEKVYFCTDEELDSILKAICRRYE